MGGGYGGGHNQSNGKSTGNAVLNSNIANLATKYPMDQSGKFGVSDKGLSVQVVSSSDPDTTAKEFLGQLSKGGEMIPLPNKKGFRFKFTESTWFVFRPVSSSGGPAIDFYFGKNSPNNYKIHFKKLDGGIGK